MTTAEDRKPTSKVSAREQIVATGALVATFGGVAMWFGLADVYHRHFFSTGAIVAAHNLIRTVFVAVLAWLIYAPGAGLAALIVPAREQAALTSAERAVLGFGMGVALWHLSMLILGV